MKWKNILSVLPVVFFLSVSCCGLKKSRTTTETITVTKVDTIIKVVTDTVLKTVSVPLFDTAVIDTEIAQARAFYNVKTQRIDLQLKGKVLEVPVQMQRVQYVTKKEVIKEPVVNWVTWLYLLVILLIFLFGIVITKKFQNLLT